MKLDFSTRSDRNERYENGWFSQILQVNDTSREEMDIGFNVLDKLQAKLNREIDRFEKYGYTIIAIILGGIQFKEDGGAFQSVAFHLERGNKKEKGNWLVK